MGFSAMICECCVRASLHRLETSLTTRTRYESYDAVRAVVEGHTVPLYMDRTNDEGSQCETLDLCVVPKTLFHRCSRHDIRVKHYMVRGGSRQDRRPPFVVL